MLTKVEHYSDNLSNHRHFLDGVEEGHHSTLKTDITLMDFNGDELVRVQNGQHNMTILGGRLDLLEKSFGITPNPAQRLLLNNMIPDPMTEDPIEYLDIPHGTNVFDSTDIFLNPNRFNRFCNYWCIGDGGEDKVTAYKIHDVKPWESRLYHAVPFRCVPATNDLLPEEQEEYRLRKRITIAQRDYWAYYAKKFAPGVILSKKDDADYLGNQIKVEDSEPYGDEGQGHSMRGHTVNVFIEFVLELTAIEFKEFFRATHNDSLHGARLSELGLITGYDIENANDGNRKELANAELFAKLTHDVVFLTTEGSRRRVMYKIYS